jgi:tetratricopeptide (TPR) repeat protein
MIRLIFYILRDFLSRGGPDGPPSPASRRPSVTPSGSTPTPRQRSRLGSYQQRALWVIVALGVLMLADTLYLLAKRAAGAMGSGYFAVTEISLPPFYQIMLLGHTALGILLVVLTLAFVEWHLPAVWRRHRRRAITTGVTTVVLAGVLLVTGLFILSEANSRENAWAWWLHVVAAAALPGFYLAHRRFSIWKPSAQSYRVVPVATVGLAALAVVAHGVTYDREAYTEAAEAAFAAGTHTGPGSREWSKVGDATTFVPANFVPVESPFFPSATTTTTGTYLPSRIITRGNLPEQEMIEREVEQQGFVVSEKLGAASCERCHAATVAQWAASAHRFASFNNPFYEATINDMRENSTNSNAEIDGHVAYFTNKAKAEGGQDLRGREALVKSKWCSGCHDPALMLAGKMSGEIDRRSPQAQAGLTCLACHAIDKIHGVTGNGNYNIADHQEDPYLFPDAAGGLGQVMHDVALKARPAVHKAQMLKPFFRTSEFCASCHKVSLDTRINGYRWLRGQDEYDNWHDSGVALNASRTFYLPPVKRVCQDCHMPLEPAVEGDVSAKDGMVRSHRFLAVNTALPFLRGDGETIRRIEAFLQDEKLRVDIPALRRGDGSVQYLPGASQVALQPGEAVEFDVTVRNLGVGHTFPGGTNDSNEGWIEFSVHDDRGNLLARSGAIGEDGHVDPAAHFYKALLVDAQGRGIHARNAQDIHAPVYVRVIGPGTADAAHYGVQLPADYSGDEVRVTARLLWRKFDRKYTEFAYRTNPAGFRPFHEVPDLPVTEIARYEMVLPVGGGGTASESMSSPKPAWLRHNDYGIALLLQGDTRNAMAAFEEAARLAPERVDGVRNMARVALQDGDLERTYALLERCEEMLPGDPQSAWIWGVAHQRAGRYADAEGAYRHVLTRFPEDRATWRNLGRVLYLDGRFEASLQAMAQVLEIDPEDRSAHYHRMLSLRSLGRDEEAAAAEQAYQYYQVDESAQRVTRTYRMEHPHANREAQRIHVHELTLTSGGTDEL